MNFWQFKFNMIKGEWDEFDTITAGEQFTQSTTRNLLSDCIGDIVFYYRSDKERGIWFIAEIVSEPYIKNEYNTGYAIDLRIIKRLDTYFDYEKKFPDLHNYYNTSSIRKRVQIQERIKEEFKPQKLYNLLMKNTKKLDVKELIIDENDTKIASKIKQKHIDDGCLFNAFHNLNLIRGEVKHLAFIGHLLNPYGNHFKGNLFLNHFINSLLEYSTLKENEYLQNFTKNNPFVKIEKKINDSGRIDLWLENDEYIIAVEGKIEAKDNEGQLQKYNDYLKKYNKKYLLIYLTLKRGEKPEKINMKKLSNFHLMNFEKDILTFINSSINDESITKNTQKTLSDYKDALIKYMYNYHLSFEYSHDLLKEITRNKRTFEKYQGIKEYYYRNMAQNKHTIIKDIAENFEYAKAYIERLFFENLYQNIIQKLANRYAYELDSDLSLEDTDISIAKDIFCISEARKERVNSIGQGSITLAYKDNSIKIDNDFFGLKINAKETNDINNQAFIKLESSIFKSNNISKLLDKKYLDKQINIVLEALCLS